MLRECSCLFYEPGLVTYECEPCRKKREARLQELDKSDKVRYDYGVNSDSNQQAEQL